MTPVDAISTSLVVAPDGGGDPADDLARVGEALRAGGHVGVLGDDDEGPQGSVSEVLSADHDARSGEAALGEHTGGRARWSAAITTKSSDESLMPTFATWARKPAGSAVIGPSR